jgi:predicted transcriptional regulator
MNTAKDKVQRLLDWLPEDASFDDIQYHVAVLGDITQGVEEIDRGEGIEHEEVKRRLAKWLDE